jgi:polyhydroxybutyrate depolymerase
MHSDLCRKLRGGAPHGLVALLAIAVLLTITTAAHAATFTLSPGTSVVGVNQKMSINAIYDPDGPGLNVPQYLGGGAATWSSSDPHVLTVAGGMVTGVRDGTVQVTARYRGLTATATLTVSGIVTTHTVLMPSGVKRTYQVYAPSGYRQGTPTPLVLVFHGGGGDPRLAMTTTQMNRVAHPNVFLVAYPQGMGGMWNAGCCRTGSQTGSNDVEFTRRVLDDVSTHFSVDTNRIFAAGFSNGGAFVHRLGHELADRIAAIAVASGAVTPGGDFTPAPPIRSVSVLLFHGTTDENVPYPEGQQARDYWLQRNEMPPQTPARVYQHGIEVCDLYSAPDAEIVMCSAAPPQKIVVNGTVYDGGGHAWPGGTRGPVAECDIPTADMDASGAIWSFFVRHPMS